MTLNLGNRIAPPRFVAYALALIAIALWCATQMHGGQKDSDKALAHFLIGFDIATFLFLASLFPMFRTHDAKRIAEHAARNDANRTGLLIITVAISMVVLGAVTLVVVGGGPGYSKPLVIATLALSWIFANTVYALHYAHLYYGAGKTRGSYVGGIDIPSTKQPDYFDFLHFSLILGMTFQTADIDITSPSIRRVSTGQCLAAFVFNIGILSFSINMIAGK
ncbi:DUF1345 domain-containing protein [Sphingomonas bacterium]|uniref:DUF1345 domain-containing protein n=1 Tax=Sphingomonas bacterium TaxID=1895847 RepID=UPI00262F4CD5|nr:DUF1345 domain-containing protein [Sphingomonas bacterium]MDB5677811.1 hypothetical protein [Sphingomonas bacterium]